MKRLIIICSLFLFMFSSCDSPMGDLNSSEQQTTESDNISSQIPPDTSPARADSIRKALWQQFKEQHGTEWQIRWSKTTGLPVSIFSGLTKKAYPGNAEQAARAFLGEYATLLGVSDLDQLQYVKTQTHRGIRSVTFQQYYQDIPVQGAEYKIHLRGNGKVDMANGYYYPEIDVSSSPSVSANAAIDVAKDDLNLSNPEGESNNAELFVLPESEENFVLMWKINVFAEKPSTDWLYYIDANSGRVIQKVNQVTDVTGDGDVYPNSPCLSSVSNQDLYGLYGNGYLDGTYAEIFNSSSSEAYSGSHSFVYSNDNTHFDEVSLYYHVDNFRRDFIEGLDADNDLFDRLNAYAHNNSECPDNACYSSSTGDIYFSDTYDYAREDKVVHHEYSHAVVDHIESGIDSWANEEGAISEGTPDYWAGSFTGRSQILDCALPAAERDMANPDIGDYDQYLAESPGAHRGGEFFSAILWDLYNAGGISASEVDFLTYDALYRVTGDPDFLEFRDAMMTADNDAYSGNNNDLIQDTFADRGVGTHVPPDVSISGPDNMYEGETDTFTANVSGGHPPYQYEWFYKNDNDSFYTRASGETSSTYDHTAGPPPGGNVKVVVTDSEDASQMAIHNFSIIGFN